MGLIKEPVGVDFVVDPRPLTKTEERFLVERICADKAKRTKKGETFEVQYTDIMLLSPEATDIKKRTKRKRTRSAKSLTL